MKKRFYLSKADREYLQELLSKGSLKVKIYKRAQGLLYMDAGKSVTEIGRCLSNGEPLAIKLSILGSQKPGRRSARWSSDSHFWGPTRQDNSAGL